MFAGTIDRRGATSWELERRSRTAADVVTTTSAGRERGDRPSGDGDARDGIAVSSVGLADEGSFVVRAGEALERVVDGAVASSS